MCTRVFVAEGQMESWSEDDGGKNRERQSELKRGQQRQESRGCSDLR